MKSKCQTAFAPDQAENLRCLGHKQDLNTGFTKEQRAWEGKSGQERVAGCVQVPTGEKTMLRVRCGFWQSHIPTLRPERRANPGDFLFPGLSPSRSISLLFSERPSTQADPAQTPAAYLTRPRPPGRPAGSGKPPGGEAWRRWSRRSRDRPASGSLSAHTPRAPLWARRDLRHAHHVTRAARSADAAARARGWGGGGGGGGGAGCGPPNPWAPRRPPRPRPGPRPRPPASRRRRFRPVLPSAPAARAAAP